MSPKGFFDKVYKAQGADALRSVYDEHAAEYDREVAGAEYVTPDRVAAALASHVGDRDAAVLDFACGTGLSGQALARAGFTTLDGLDISEGMLAQARAKGVYRHLIHAEPEDPLPGSHAHIVATGAISVGAAPAAALDRIVEALPSGGCLAFSFNDHTLADDAYTGRLAQLLASGSVEHLFSEHGPHLPARGMMATVHVLRKH